jgi:Putative Na+/H+ antiporter
MLDAKISENFLHAMLALLFVNISVGGGLTHFAAPPILIVASKWGWGLKDVFVNLGEPVLLAVFLNTTIFTYIFRKKIAAELNPLKVDSYPMPLWVVVSHILFLILIVLTAHHAQVFMGLFLIFIGLTSVTKSYQDGLKFKEGFLVAFFLAGLIVFGPFQRWWLEPILTAISEKALYFTATALTAVTDNAALTYLGSQVPQMSEVSRWALVSGAISGGGLSILANAPNPAGFSILSSKFSGQTLNAFKLFLAALPMTVIVMICFVLIGKF